MPRTVIEKNSDTTNKASHSFMNLTKLISPLVLIFIILFKKYYFLLIN